MPGCFAGCAPQEGADDQGGRAPARRFSAALGLHGLDAVDETAIVEVYRDQPEQLLTKLTYLTLNARWFCSIRP